MKSAKLHTYCYPGEGLRFMDCTWQGTHKHTQAYTRNTYANKYLQKHTQAYKSIHKHTGIHRLIHALIGMCKVLFAIKLNSKYFLWVSIIFYSFQGFLMTSLIDNCYPNQSQGELSGMTYPNSSGVGGTTRLAPGSTHCKHITLKFMSVGRLH